MSFHRQKKILMDRLNVPAAIHQFTNTLEKDQASKLFKLLSKYKPEEKREKRQRLKAEADQKAKGEEVKQGDKPMVIKYGLNHITTLVENKQAQLVIMAHDVVPMELMIFLPTLCRKNKVPFCFVKGKARLGSFVHKKTATCLALTEVRREDQNDFENLRTFFNGTYNENSGLITKEGEPIMGIKNQHKRQRRRGGKK